MRVLVLQEKLLTELHRVQPGICKMKSIAHGYLWWPGIDQELEKLAKGCVECSATQNSPPVSLVKAFTSFSASSS